MTTDFYTDVRVWGDNILYSGYKDKKRIRKKINYYPTLFIPTDKETKFKSLHGKPVGPINPGTIKDCRNFIKKYQGTDGFDIYGNTNYAHAMISDAYVDRGVIQWDENTISIYNIDIEVQSDQGFPQPEDANFPITSIAIRNRKSQLLTIFTVKDWEREKSDLSPELLDKVYHVKCNNEVNLLLQFLQMWKINPPDVITGWNIKLFDVPYIVNRIKKVLGDNKAKEISPWNIIRAREVNFGARVSPFYEIYGIQQLDFMDCFKKFGYVYGPLESYSLNNVAHVVLGEKKLDYSEYGTLHNLYNENPQLYFDYNIRDVDLVDRLINATGLLTLAFEIAYRGMVNLNECFGSVSIWDCLIYNELRQKNIVVPLKTYTEKERGIVGGYVKDPHRGLHKWIATVDISSLYPHIIQQCNISPDTIVDKRNPDISVDNLLEQPNIDIPENYCMSATGQYFLKNKKGILPEILEKIYAERKEVRKQLNKLEKEKSNSFELEEKKNRLFNQQQALKILINSVYGCLSNEYFRYFDIRMAESITTTGQLCIRWAEKIVNDYFNKVLDTDDVDYVIAIDTDSLMISLEALIDKLGASDIDKCTNIVDKTIDVKILPLIDKGYNELAKYLNCSRNEIEMKREVIASAGFWVAKKRYALNVLNREGIQFDEPESKIMGIEVVRSSTPPIVRSMLKNAIKIILNEGESKTQDFIEQCREKFNQAQIDEISFPRGVSDLEKYSDPRKIYTKHTPIHTRGALLYNNFVKEHNLEGKYQPIFSGDKIKFIYLKEPNIIHENVIAFINILPEEMDLENCIDRNKQFDKSFLEPIKNIFNVIGWNVTKTISLDCFL